MKTLLTAREVDKILRYPRGRTARLARAGSIPHITLPDGEIRFDPEAIERMLVSATTEPTPADPEVAHVQ